MAGAIEEQLKELLEQRDEASAGRASAARPASPIPLGQPVQPVQTAQPVQPVRPARAEQPRSRCERSGRTSGYIWSCFCGA